METKKTTLADILSSAPKKRRSSLTGASLVQQSKKVRRIDDFRSSPPEMDNQMEEMAAYDLHQIQDSEEMTPAMIAPPKKSFLERWDDQSNVQNLSHLTLTGNPLGEPIIDQPEQQSEQNQSETTSKNLRNEYFSTAKVATEMTDYRQAYTCMKEVYLISMKTNIKDLRSEELVLLSFTCVVYYFELIKYWKIATRQSMQGKKSHATYQVYKPYIIDEIKVDADLFIPNMLSILVAPEELTVETRAAFLIIVANLSWFELHVKKERSRIAENFLTLAGKCGLQEEHPLLQCQRLSLIVFNLLEPFNLDQSNMDEMKRRIHMINKEIKRVNEKIQY